MDNGEAVDTYWPAAAAEISPEIRYGTVLTLPILGGDSENDFCSFKIQAQNNTAAPDWAISTGINRDDNQYTGRVSLTVHGVSNSDFPAGLYGAYGKDSSTFRIYGYEPEEVFVEASKSSCRFERKGYAPVVVSSEYTLADYDVRKVYVRSVSTRIFYWFEYRNSRTNVCFYICAMKSTSGASALYSDYDMTLVEV